GRVNTLKPARVIKIFERLGHRRRAIVYRLLDKDLALEVFEGLSPVLQSDLVDALQERDTVDLFANMAPDDRVWLLDELPRSEERRVGEGCRAGRSSDRRHVSKTC